MREAGNRVALSMCMWCGESVAVVMLTAVHIPAHKGLPDRAVFSPDPCPECKATMDKGITCVEVSPYAAGYEIKFQCKMTGRWAVVTEDGLAKMFDDTAESLTICEQAKKHRTLLFDTETYTQLFSKAVSKDEQA